MNYSKKISKWKDNHLPILHALKMQKKHPEISEALKRGKDGMNGKRNTVTYVTS